LILKDKASVKALSATAKAGLKQEQDVAFFLRRHFKDKDDIFIFNDLKFCYNDETAQIDHLVLYPFGFILIESKSITGEVTVNKQQEWSRSYQDRWSGIASPIKQVELQQKLLQELLHENRASILSTILFKQQSFRFRCWDNICAISSNAIIDRENIPKDISKQLVKSEFLPERVLEVMNLKNSIINVINPLDTRPAFNKKEMDSIAQFLLSQDCSQTPAAQQTPSSDTISTTVPKTHVVAALASKNITVTCSKCSEDKRLTPSNGKFGYYLKCQSCQGNTAMKQPCPHCQSKQTKVSKKKENYTLNCQSCEQKTAISV